MTGEWSSISNDARFGLIPTMTEKIKMNHFSRIIYKENIIFESKTKIKGMVYISVP